jgi:surfactin synthase thioesterase subunit
MPNAWFLTTGTVPEPTARVYCFPHAGGDPRLALAWQDAVAPAEIVAMRMPGRGARFGEPAPTTVEEYADGAAAAIAQTADRPCYLFGHSFGALMAFEVARRLPHVDLRALVVSGCAAPALLPSARVVEAAGLEGREFVTAVRFFGGLPAEVLTADEDLQHLLLTDLKADFRLAAAWVHRPAGRLDVPVHLICGRNDPHVSSAAMAGWSDVTTHTVSRSWGDGGHFYFDDEPAAVTDALHGLLTADGLDVADHEIVELI